MALFQLSAGRARQSAARKLNVMSLFRFPPKPGVRKGSLRMQLLAWLLWFPALASAAPTPVTRAALPPAATEGRGAETPFVTYEAEDAATNGAVLGPDRRQGQFAAEASGRRSVRIAGAEGFVEFVLERPASAVTIRYAIPDSTDGKGLDTRAVLYANGKRLAAVPLTSRYSWYYGRYPFTNRPRDGRAHHFYDHVRLRLPAVLPAGTRLSLRLDEQAKVAWAIIDLIDAELVPPPLAAPPEALSVVDLGADPSGSRSSYGAFTRAIAIGSETGRPVWIPSGEYRIDGHLLVDRVTLSGAGHWHSVLRGDGIGLYGRRRGAFSNDVVLRDFAIIGEVTRREDSKPLAAIGGAFKNSSLSGLWIQHTKVGLWLDGPTDRLTISDLRIVDQAADGLNFAGGVTDSTVRNSFIRNTGDDGLAMWSRRSGNSGNRFIRNTVIAPLLANGIAIYGGRDIAVTGNLIADSVTEGGGIHLGSRFGATPFDGVIDVTGNTVVRGGVLDPNWKFGVGAFWIYALDQPISGARIHVSDLTLIDSLHAALHFIGKPITNVSFSDVRVQGAGAGVLQIQADGAASFNNVTATGLGGSAIASYGSNFTIIDEGGNQGWSTQDIIKVR